MLFLFQIEHTALINLLIFCKLNNIKFVIRFRNNCRNIPKKIRTIIFSENIIETITNDNIDKKLINNKKFKSVTLKTTNKYTLVTNLNIKDYDDNKIKNIYHKRWDIEVFFKILKKNFKFSDLRITNQKQNSDQYSIHNLKILIITILAKIMEKIHLYENRNDIKLEGVIIKRKIKNKINKNNNIYKKKNIKKVSDIPIINVDIKNNKKVILEDVNNVNSNTNDVNDVNSNVNDVNQGKILQSNFCLINYIKVYQCRIKKF